MLKRIRNMKKLVYSVLAIAALFAAVSCEKNLDNPIFVDIRQSLHRHLQSLSYQ